MIPYTCRFSELSIQCEFFKACVGIQPTTTEEAQYSTSFPVAVALARGDVTPQDISDEALNNPAIVKLSKCLVMRESEKANEQFPENRLAKVTIILKKIEKFL